MPVASRTLIGGSSAEDRPALLKAIPSSYDRQYASERVVS